MRGRILRRTDLARRHRGRLVLLVVALVLIGGAVGLRYVTSPQSRVIESSYVFDVTDPNLVAGFVDNIFVGRVDKQVDVDETFGWTTYEVTVFETYKGNLREKVLVSQLGYRTWREIAVPEGQPLLTPGKTYVLATGDRGDGIQSVPGGPHSVAEFTAQSKAMLQSKWAAAIENARYPSGIPPK